MSRYQEPLIVNAWPASCLQKNGCNDTSPPNERYLWTWLFKKSASTFCCSLVPLTNSLRCVLKRFRFMKQMNFVSMKMHSLSRASRNLHFLTAAPKWCFRTLSNTLTNCYEVFCWTTYWRMARLSKITNWSSLRVFFYIFFTSDHIPKENW